MSLTKDERAILVKTYDKVIELTVLLLGSRGDNGLIGDVKRLASSHYRLKRNFYIIIGILLGSGIIGGVSVYGLFNGA